MPFECQYCGEIYCGNHRRPDDHRCRVGGDRDQLYVIICPICETRIQQKANEDADQLWRVHSSSGECEKQLKVKAERDRREAALIKVCQVPRCKNRLTHITRQQCARCMIETCMQHRLPEAHDCQQKITSDPRLAKSKLLQLNQKPKAQPAAYQAAQSQHTAQSATAMTGGLISSERDL